jgi:hypothetical protein
MARKTAHEKPSAVSAEEGDVLVDGPGGVAISLTPEAAIETSDRLLEAGVSAAGQRHERKGSARRSEPHAD